MEKHKWTERAIQNLVYMHCAGVKTHRIVVPNSCLFAWEADMLSVTRSGRIHEFEIKISRSDFLADRKKDRTALLLDPRKTSRWGGTRVVDRPNYFHYVVPEGLVAAHEVPGHAGLMYVRPDVRTPKVIKDPALLHKLKITNKQMEQLTGSLAARFWRARLEAR